MTQQQYKTRDSTPGKVVNTTAIMAATVESTAKALETATISKTKELKGVCTPPFGQGNNSLPIGLLLMLGRIAD